LKRLATICSRISQSDGKSSSRLYDYHKVLDNRKHPIRGETFVGQETSAVTSFIVGRFVAVHIR
jgi:hypothetical protein